MQKGKLIKLTTNRNNEIELNTIFLQNEWLKSSLTLAIIETASLRKRMFRLRSFVKKLFAAMNSDSMLK